MTDRQGGWGGAGLLSDRQTGGAGLLSDIQGWGYRACDRRRLLKSL